MDEEKRNMWCDGLEGPRFDFDYIFAKRILFISLEVINCAGVGEQGYLKDLMLFQVHFYGEIFVLRR